MTFKSFQNLLLVLKTNSSREINVVVFLLIEPYRLEKNRYGCWMAPAVLLASRRWQIEGFGGLTERETGVLGWSFFFEWSITY